MSIKTRIVFSHGTPEELSAKYEGKQLSAGEIVLVDSDGGFQLSSGSSRLTVNAEDVKTADGSLSDALKLKVKKLETDPYIAVEMPECTADSNNSIAVGDAVSALEAFSFAEGTETIAKGEFSHAAGDCSQAIGYSSHAEGWESYSYGDYAHSEGDYTKAYGYGSHSEGAMTMTFGDYAHSEGKSTYANGYCSHAEGVYTSTGKCSHAEGTCTIADTMHGHAEGYATAAGSIVKIGQLKAVSCITDPSGHEWGGTESANSSYDSISVRWQIALDTAAGSAGKKIADLISTDTIEFGYEGQSTENYIIPEEICESADGYQLTAYNFAKIPGTMMWDNKLLLSVSNNDYASFINCFADKNNNSSVGSYFSDANPNQSRTVTVYALNAQLPTGEYLDNSSYSRYGHAEGLGTIAAGRNSHAEGERTRAFGSASHAEGYDTTATGYGAKVNGVHSFAEGKYSTAIGKCVNSKADYSIAAGMCCTAEHTRSFVWSGPYPGHNTNNYKSKGNGTFCINPDAGLNGFWIGDKNFTSCVANSTTLMDESQKNVVKNNMFAQQISADSDLTSFYDTVVNHPEQAVDSNTIVNAICKLMNVLGYNA